MEKKQIWIQSVFFLVTFLLMTIYSILVTLKEQQIIEIEELTSVILSSLDNFLSKVMAPFLIMYAHNKAFKIEKDFFNDSSDGLSFKDSRSINQMNNQSKHLTLLVNDLF